MASNSSPKAGTVRWLAANGFPGFSAATARRVLALQERFPGLSFHAAVYGGVELAYRQEVG